MSDLQKYKEKQMQNPEFKTEYEHSRSEFERILAYIDARTKQDSDNKEREIIADETV